MASHQDNHQDSATAAEFVLSQTTAVALELPETLRMVAAAAATDLGQERCLALWPTADRELLRQTRRRYEEVERLLAAAPLVPYCDQKFAPLLGALAHSRRDIDGKELVEIGALLQTGQRARQRINSADPTCPELVERLAEVPSGESLRLALERTFDPRGEIREDATPALAKLRRRIRSVRQDIYQNLQTLVGTHREHLSEDTIPMRGGRLVLMLQAGSRGRVSGLTHGRSGRGKSFYFEPLEAVEDNNRLQQSVEEEAAERRRILAQMIDHLRRELPTVVAHGELVAELDALQAAVRFAQGCDGRLAEIGERHQLKLLGARHPLLEPRLAELRQRALGTPGHSDPVVPLELEFSAAAYGLVITGPNAGGKTVALKTTGLLALLHQCGLPIPAGKGSRLPPLSAVVAAVGDEQDLLADRSTFSGRLLRLRDAWQAAGEDSLLLIDELGSGTDPEEGAALSVALLEGLIERRALTLITTHLSQVAAAALELKGASCAAMQFDSSSGAPTYRLLTGPPGGSEALALARRLRLPDAWLNRAKELLGPEHRDLRRLLAEVERAREQLEDTQRELAAEQQDAELLRRRLADELEQASGERKLLSKNLRSEMAAFRTEVQKKLRSEIDRLQREVRGGKARRSTAQAVERLFDQAPRLATDDDDAPSGEIYVGATVRHRLLEWTGELEKLNRGRAQVRVHGKTLRCTGEELTLVAAADSAKPHRPRRPPTSIRSTNDLEDSGPGTELKLIGLRVEPAMETLDRFLDQALMGSPGEVRIIHGHGSGRLRRAVREQLKRHPAVASQRPGGDGEGGDGATVVKLRDA